MKKICTFATNRSEYDIRDAESGSITIGELIEALRGFDEDMRIVFKNDNGYTYGYISADDIDVEYVETREEEERREALEEMETDLEYAENDRDEELADLESRYTNTEEGEVPMTDEDYHKERAEILDQYEKEVESIKKHYNDRYGIDNT